jgi:hypothetical protein
VRIADLLEAEGRSARKAVERLGMSLSLIVVAAVLVLAGCVLLLGGALIGLEREIGPAGAAAITGVITLGVAGGLFWWSSRISK